MDCTGECITGGETIKGLGVPGREPDLKFPGFFLSVLVDFLAVDRREEELPLPDAGLSKGSISGW